jgi:hypothetical protein
MNMREDPFQQALAASSLPAGALDAFRGCLRNAEAMIPRTEELATKFAAAVPLLSVGPIMVELHSGWADLDARLQYLDSISCIGSSRELWTHPTMQRLLRASDGVIVQGLAYVVRHGPAASEVLRQLRQFVARMKSHGPIRRMRHVEEES